MFNPDHRQDIWPFSLVRINVIGIDPSSFERPDIPPPPLNLSLAWQSIVIPATKNLFDVIVNEKTHVGIFSADYRLCPLVVR